MNHEEFEESTPRETSALFDAYAERESVDATRFGIHMAAFHNATWKRKDGKLYTAQDFGAPKFKEKPKTEADLRLEQMANALKARMAFRMNSATRRFKSKRDPERKADTPRRRRKEK